MTSEPQARAGEHAGRGGAGAPGGATAGPAPGRVAGPLTTKRKVYLVLGVICFGLAVLGIILPLVPATIFLILGSFFLTRSSPKLEEWMLSKRLFRPYAEFLRSEEPMPAKQRFFAIAAMWVSIAISTGTLLYFRKLGPVGVSVMALTGIGGTVAIMLFRRKGKGGPTAAQTPGAGRPAAGSTQ